MKRLLAIASLTLLLTACGAKTVRLNAETDMKDLLRLSLLKDAIARTIDGRLAAKEKKLLSLDMKEGEASLTIEAKVSDAEAAELLMAGLTAPFTMEIMKQVDAGMGDIISEKYGEFKETGLTTKYFDWVHAGTGVIVNGTPNGSVIIDFTKEGQTLLQDIFRQNRGKEIGIFVRGMLMSKKTVDKTDTQTGISIDGIPSMSLANAFADDVNVGLHVKFTPAQ